jgi:hypothetical protein
MSGQQPAFPESLDEILNVVRETPRGRWFIEAYTNRVQTGGTSTILTAISKLESSLQSMSGSGADAALLQKARQHIAQARADIVSSEQGKMSLSSEGQLFAKLADLSRKAFSDPTNQEPAIAKSVERVLRLVADLDQDLGTSLVPMPVAAPKPAAQYFKQDDDVFEPAPAPAPLAIKQIKSIKPVEPAARGAKLVIQHLDLNKTVTTDSPSSDFTKPEIVEPIAITTTEVQAAVPEPSRIVIIRKKAEDLIEVPLVDESVAEAEAQVSAA